MFNVKSTTQAVAYLLGKAGGSLHCHDLMRMLYAADRSMYAEFEEPMTGDLAVSMEYGPALSATLSLMEGRMEPGYWCELISPLKNDVLSLASGIDPANFGEISEADQERLDAVFAKYSSKSAWNEADIASEFPEWGCPDGGGRPIDVAKILLAVGKDPNVIPSIMESLEEMDALERAWDRLEREESMPMLSNDGIEMAPKQVLSMRTELPSGEKRENYYIVLTEAVPWPEPAAQPDPQDPKEELCVLLVPWRIKKAGQYFDECCILRKGDHPQITQESWIDYRRAKVMPVRTIKKGIVLGMLRL
ncbi:MAG: SocA family protein [Holophagales bacterium]|jgi:hypothetical protein|nr:SocA family protein [Holophagales bacterium]